MPLTDALIKNLLDAAGPEHRARIPAEVPDSMCAEVGAAISAQDS